MDTIETREHPKELIVFLGQATFPSGFGAVQRMKLMGKALLGDGYRVTVICRKGGSHKNMKLDFGPTGSYEGIEYRYTSGTIYRPDGFFERNYLKIKGALAEFRYLSRLKRKENLRAGIISSHGAFHLLRYRIYSLLIGFPIVLNLVEMTSSIKSRTSKTKKLNDFFLDHYMVRLMDGALPISDYLMKHYNKLSPAKPTLKLPILCDFSKFDPTAIETAGTTFTYCGAASYLELVSFIGDAFDRLKSLDDSVVLQMILGGTEEELKKVRQLLSKLRNKNHIQLVSNAPHDKIPEYYSKASALLIPLRPTLQDEARFPHKIGEYLASARPMITCRYGEIRYYGFEDKRNALITDVYDESAFAEKMAYVLEHPDKAKEIGKKGRELGLEHFDYSKYGRILRGYFSKLKR